MPPLHALCTLAQECGIIAHARESLARNLPLLWRLWWCESFGVRFLVGESLSKESGVKNL